MSIPDTVGEHDITKGNAHFLSSLKYRGQLYSKVYGQATPSTIGQMTSALTVIDLELNKFHFRMICKYPVQKVCPVMI